MTLSEVYSQSLKRLQNPDVEEINIRIILCDINSLKSMSDFYLRKDEEIRDLPRFQQFFERYLSGEPVQYILGKTEFYGTEFVVDKRVLIPRQESEEVVDFAIKKTHELFGGKKIDVADVCCGSGAMGLSLAKKLDAKHLYLTDISKDALEVARINAKKLGLKSYFYCGDCLEELIANNIKVDIVISNPPYILRKENVDKSVLDYEPKIALFSDDDFSIYRRIISKLSLIKKDVLLAVFEIGIYTRSVIEPFIRQTLPESEYGFIKDINQKERILYIVLK